MTDPSVPADTPPAPASDGGGAAAPDDEARRTNRFEIAVAILLGIAALMTALSSYVADHDDGQQLNYLQASGRTYLDANDAYAAGDQQLGLDQTIFVEYATAANDNDIPLAAYLGNELSPTLAPAIKEWSKDSVKAKTPFSGDNPIYVPPQYAEGEKLDAKAQKQFDKADFYDGRGDQFVMATVIFAAALGLLGIASVVRRFALKLGFGGLGTAALIGGIVVMATNL